MNYKNRDTWEVEKPHAERKAKLLRIFLSSVLVITIAAGAFFIGHKVGYDKSYNIGFNDGYKDGYTHGDERGAKAGYDEGFAAAKRQYGPEEPRPTVKYVGPGNS